MKRSASGTEPQPTKKLVQDSTEASAKESGPTAALQQLLRQAVQTRTRAVLFLLAVANTDQADSMTLRVREKKTAASCIEGESASRKHLLEEVMEARTTESRSAMDICAC